MTQQFLVYGIMIGTPLLFITCVVYYVVMPEDDIFKRIMKALKWFFLE